MAPPSRKILVIGATGHIGKFLLNALIEAKDDFERIGIFTSAKTLTDKAELIESFKSHGLEILTGDLHNDGDILEAYKGFDTVVSAVGRTVIDKQLGLIALAEKSPGIVRFIPSEYGTDIEFDASSASEVPHQKKLLVRAFMESGANRRLKYTYIVTGPFADMYVDSMAVDPRAGSFDVATREATLLEDGKGKVGLMTMADVGRSLVAVLKHHDVCDGKAIKVNSFTTTPEDILAEFERQTESKWTVKYTTLETLRKLEAEAWAKGSPLATLYTLRRIWGNGGTLYSKMDNGMIGMTKTDTLETVVQDAVSKAKSRL